MPIEAMENWRHFDLFDDVSFHFHYVRRCNVVFLHQNSQDTCKCLYYSQILGGISFDVMAENRKHLKDTLTFKSFLMC